MAYDASREERFTRPDGSAARGVPSGDRNQRLYWLFAIPFVATLLPWIYNTNGPRAHRDPVLLLVPDGLGAGDGDHHRVRLPQDEGVVMGAHLFTLAAVKGVELAVFIVLFGLVTRARLRRRALAARRRRSTTSTSGASAAATSAAGSRWFLIGGDLYTAYTFVAVPALLFGAGAVGFFAVPYTIIVYPAGVPRRCRGCGRSSHRHGLRHAGRLRPRRATARRRSRC